MNNNMELELKTIQLQNEKLLWEIDQLNRLIQAPKKQESMQKEFLTVSEAAQMKGGAAENTYKSNRFLLPGCGNPKYSVYIAGRLAFRREDCEVWAKVPDSEYDQYALACGVKIIPEKYKKLIQKAKQKAGGISC